MCKNLDFFNGYLHLMSEDGFWEKMEIGVLGPKTGFLNFSLNHECPYFGVKYIKICPKAAKNG